MHGRVVGRVHDENRPKCHRMVHGQSARACTLIVHPLQLTPVNRKPSQKQRSTQPILMSCILTQPTINFLQVNQSIKQESYSHNYTNKFTTKTIKIFKKTILDLRKNKPQMSQETHLFSLHSKSSQ